MDAVNFVVSSLAQAMDSGDPALGQPNSISAGVLRGVPQGSVLGPVLFLLFINDLPRIVSGVNARICLFADDNISLTVRSSESQLRSSDLDIGEGLVRLCIGLNKMSLKLNGSKTNLMEFSIEWF
ncbi:uncharacterized protein LOC124374252, partial [Homalodisca vitripennis]|uniref:uncharacterized protein LOC124374252 n=1 Tax=Homalodisca vitripennis TaxID=197043 RepID=UPI001EEC289F